LKLNLYVSSLQISADALFSSIDNNKDKYFCSAEIFSFPNLYKKVYIPNLKNPQRFVKSISMFAIKRQFALLDVKMFIYYSKI